ncbi:MAG: hypothetical protein OEM99_14115, partial [Gammaproteobacteria bacterium]|nr:hypothetical protein [Gammaproteobacteria bacterium]
MARPNAPVAQLGERRLPRSGKAKHASPGANAASLPASGRARGAKRREEYLAARSAATVGWHKLPYEVKIIA